MQSVHGKNFSRKSRKKCEKTPKNRKNWKKCRRFFHFRRNLMNLFEKGTLMPSETEKIKTKIRGEKSRKPEKTLTEGFSENRPKSIKKKSEFREKKRYRRRVDFPGFPNL